MGKSLRNELGLGKRQKAARKNVMKTIQDSQHVNEEHSADHGLVDVEAKVDTSVKALVENRIDLDIEPEQELKTHVVDGHESKTSSKESIAVPKPTPKRQVSKGTAKPQKRPSVGAVRAVKSKPSASPEDHAATVLQSRFRGHQARKQVGLKRSTTMPSLAKPKPKPAAKRKGAPKRKARKTKPGGVRKKNKQKQLKDEGEDVDDADDDEEDAEDDNDEEEDEEEEGEEEEEEEDDDEDESEEDSDDDSD